MTHLDPLPEDETDELEAEFETFEEILGFVPNSLLTMQRKPEIVEGFDYLTQKVMQEADDVDPGFKRLAAHVASHSAGCQYCEAHSLVAADIHGVSQAKLDDLWEYKDSDHYSEKERAGLDFALAAGSVPNEVDDEIMETLKAHWTEDEIVELLAAISLYGFLNRWNDSMATDLEDVPREMGEEFADESWDGGKHVADE
ncbi:carboxymuconolactone decarboxylase family protein [Halorussus lipolyticus]|uniref:carboxymuconolactone decarboxylase family protein n=1 Tax=Halorussus lipolyticus TaxID=3034024 RepID=UPI0023E87D78|nr:carboxymuconolactone decarboxylase family protein [Halorussus sp. DT80]